MRGAARPQLLAPLSHPVKAGDRLSLSFTVARVELREAGFAVRYDFTWHAMGEEQPVTLGNFIVRYWPEN